MDVRGTPSPYSEDRCRVKFTPSPIVTTSSGIWKPIIWNDEDFDTNDMHDNVTQNTKIFIRRSGVYVVMAGLGFQVNGNGYRKIKMHKNEGIHLGTMIASPNATHNSLVSIQRIEEFEVGDYILLLAHQDSGIDLNLVQSACHCAVVRISA